jgi:hypothetical protein
MPKPSKSYFGLDEQLRLSGMTLEMRYLAKSWQQKLRGLST